MYSLILFWTLSYKMVVREKEVMVTTVICLFIDPKRNKKVEEKRKKNQIKKNRKKENKIYIDQYLEYIR